MSESTPQKQKHPRGHSIPLWMGAFEISVFMVFYIFVYSVVMAAIGIPSLAYWLIFTVAYFIWTYSPWATKFRNWMWDQYNGG